MKLFHLADLHLGKIVNGFPMLEDQEYILKIILKKIEEEEPQVVLIAGDVFDKGVPPIEALRLWDSFLLSLSKKKIETFAISGNHDNAIRFGSHSPLMDASGIHLSQEYSGSTKPYTMEDEYGEVNIYLLPYINPRMVRPFFPDKEIATYTEACKVAVKEMKIKKSKRNVLVAHQFITGGSTCDSEEVSVGGLDNVKGEVFKDFDYVALGHLHGPQHIGRKELRYSGTPLKYSISEKNQEKSITVVELKEKGKVEIREIPLVPMRDIKEYTGTFEDIMDKSFYKGINKEDYIHFLLTNEEEIPDVMNRLRKVYPNVMRPTYNNTRSKRNESLLTEEEVERKSPLELLEELYILQNNQPMSKEQKEFAIKCIEEVKGEKNESN